jgi:hypothetical protein
MLKPFRNWQNHSTNIFNFCYDDVEAGDLLVYKSYGRGEAADDPDAAVGLLGPTATPAELAASQPAGFATFSLTTWDRSKFWTDQWARQEFHTGGKMTSMPHGGIQVDNIDPNVPLDGTVLFGGRKVYYTNTGKVTPNNTGSPVVGRFMSEPDDDGFVRIEAHLPNLA